MISHNEFHPKGWGHELWLVNIPEYCGKVLHIEAGKRCSLHFHKIKTETMYLSKGRVRMIYGPIDNPKESTKIMEVGDVFHIPPLLAHRFEALEDSDIIEFSTQHFESDSYRIETGD